MLSRFIAFILLSLVQLALAVYGGYLAVRSLPPGERKLPHLRGFIGLGLAGVLLILSVGVQSYQSDKEAAESQARLTGQLAAANQKLENQNGQLTAIAGMLKVNSNDPAVIAAAVAQAVHPPEKSPCLRPVHVAATQRQSLDGYETVLRISNPNGVKPGTTFQFFFNTRVNLLESPDVKISSESSGGDIATVTVGAEVPKGKTLTFVARGSSIPAQVKCVDRFDPAQQER